MPIIIRDVTLLHRLQKSADATPVALAPGTQVGILKEWAEHYLIKTADGKVLTVKKEYVDPAV